MGVANRHPSSGWQQEPGGSPVECEPLHQHGRLRTQDVDQAQAVVAEVFEPHVLEPLGNGLLDARMNAVQTNSITLGYLTYGRPARIDLPRNDKWYHVNVTLSGGSCVRRSDGEADLTEGGASAAVLLPHRSQTIEWGARTEQLAIRVSRSSLESHLEAMTNRAVTGPVDFGLRVDLTTPPGRGLVRALEFATSEWDHNGMLTTNPTARRQLESMLLSSLLLSAPGQHQGWLQGGDSGRDRPDAAARVRAYLHENAHEIPTLPDILRVGQVSARTLQTQFRSAYGCTPMQYLRDLRLRNARRDLLSSAGEESVTDIAMRWGFYHLGRFSAVYSDQFGELPSRTLGRSRECPDTS